MSGVCVIGDSFVDVVTIIGQDELDFSAQGDTLADSIGLMAGGSGLNTSFRIKELMPSLEVRFLSAVGTDQQGDMLEAALDSAGIEHTLLKGGRDLDGSTGCCIVLSANTKRSFITQRGVVDTFRISHFTEDTLASQALASSHIHCAGYFNCSGLTVMRGGRGGNGDTSANANRKVVDLTDLFREARDSGRTTSLNPQDDASGIWKLPAALLEQVTYLFGNEEELTSIATVIMNTESVATAGENREVKGNRRAIAECFLASGCGVVVMTKGKDGVEAYRYITSSSGSSEDRDVECLVDDGIDLQRLGLPLVDTTGAGDAFVGGFLQVIASSPSSSSSSPHAVDLREALRTGCVAGAHACLLTGGSAMDREKLAALQELVA